MTKTCTKLILPCHSVLVQTEDRLRLAAVGNAEKIVVPCLDHGNWSGSNEPSSLRAALASFLVPQPAFTANLQHGTWRDKKSKHSNPASLSNFLVSGCFQSIVYILKHVTCANHAITPHGTDGPKRPAVSDSCWIWYAGNQWRQRRRNEVPDAAVPQLCSMDGATA